VSPLWRDEVGIFVGPQRIVLNRMSRGLRPACVADHAAPVEGAGVNDWGPALAVLAAELADPRWQDARARVVVANHWVRYAIVPWRKELSDDEERLAHGRLVLQEVFGDALAGWDVALGETLTGLPQLACAMPGELQAEIERILQAAKLRTISFQPHLVVSFNRWRHRMPPVGGWLVSIDDGMLAAVRLNGESWEEVRCVRIGSDWSAELRRLQTFGRLAGGGPESSKVLVEAPFWLRRIAAAQSEALEWLEPGEGEAGTLERLARLAEMHA
jgi:hypothetical protein